MSKEELILAIRNYGCGKLKQIPLDYMTKEQIITHLVECKCDLIIKLITKKI